MAANINYRGLQCPALSQILQSKGIQRSNKKKDELVDLCEGAKALKLPDIDKKNDDSEAAVLRSTVKVKTYPDPLDQQNQLSWTKSLSGMPTINAFDVTTFLQTWCGWSADRLQRRKSDNTYKLLHCAGHIHDVIMSTLGM